MSRERMGRSNCDFLLAGSKSVLPKCDGDQNQSAPPPPIPSTGYPPVHEYMQITVRLSTQEEEEDPRLQTSH